MKKRIRLLCALTLVTAFVLTAAAAQSQGDGRDSIRIAALYNLTGGMSSIDAPALKGARLAARAENRAGGLPGGGMLEIIPFDTKTDERYAVDTARKAAGTGVAAAIGYGDSTYVLLAAPAFQERGIPFVTSGATLPDLPARVGDCLFMTAFGDDAQARAIADFAYRDLKAGGVVVWTDSTMDFTKALSRYFKDYFTNLGGRILDERLFKAGEKDYSKLIAALKAMKPQPDAVFVSAIPNEAGLTVKQIRESGVKIPIISGDGFDTDLIVTVPGKERASHIYFATHIFRGEKSKEAEEFVRAYTEEYGHAPESAFAALGFDSVRLISKALRKAGTTGKKALARAIRTTTGFKGITGEISFRNPERPPDKPVSIMGVEKGVFRAVKVWKP